MSTADQQFHLHAPATPDVLEAVHALLHHFWHHVPDMTDSDRMRFDLAVAEVAANIVEHGSRGADITLNLRVSPAGVEADFDETGEPLPDNIINGAALPEDDFSESGRGLVLARASLDEFTYAREGDHNHWHLARHRH